MQNTQRNHAPRTMPVPRTWDQDTWDKLRTHIISILDRNGQWKHEPGNSGTSGWVLTPLQNGVAARLQYVFNLTRGVPASAVQSTRDEAHNRYCTLLYNQGYVVSQPEAHVPESKGYVLVQLPCPR